MLSSLKPCRAILALIVLLFAGCELNDNTPKLSRDITELGTKLEATQAKIDASTKHIEAIDTQIKTTQKERIDSLEQQKTQAAEFVYGANQANTTNTAPNLYTRHVGTELIRASAILGMPTQQSILDANRRLELLLSQKEQDLAALKAAYEEKDKAIVSLQGALETNKTALKSLDQEHQQTVSDRDTFKNEKIQIGTELDKKKTELIAKQQSDLRRAEDTKALKKQMMVYLTIAGILTGLLAAAAFKFYPPVVIPLGIASGGFFAAAYLITQLSKWEFIGILAAIGAAIGIAAYIKYRRTSQIGDNAIGAMQELKNRAGDGDENALSAYGELRKHLVDWYGEKGHALENEIEGRLRKLNLVGNTPIPSLSTRLKTMHGTKAGPTDTASSN